MNKVLHARLIVIALLTALPFTLYAQGTSEKIMSSEIQESKSLSLDKKAAEQTIQVKPFGEINPDKVDEYYAGEIIIKGNVIELDLNFEGNAVAPDTLLSIAGYINNLESNIETAMQLIATDYDLDEESETARDYLSHHLEVMDKNDLHALFGNEDPSKELFLSKLNVYRVGFYPEDNEGFVIIDVQFQREFTDYLMAITLDKNFKLIYIGMDS